MLHVPATEFAKRFARWRREAQRAPVAVTHHGEVTEVLMSRRDFEEFERLRGQTAETSSRENMAAGHGAPTEDASPRTKDEPWRDAMIREGLPRPARAPFPAGFFSEPLAKMEGGGSAVAVLLEERRGGW